MWRMFVNFFDFSISREDWEKDLSRRELIDDLLIFKLWAHERNSASRENARAVLFQNDIVLFEKTFRSERVLKYLPAIRNTSVGELASSGQVEKISKLKFNLGKRSGWSDRSRHQLQRQSTHLRVANTRLLSRGSLPSFVLSRKANYPRHVFSGETLPDCGEKGTLSRCRRFAASATTTSLCRYYQLAKIRANTPDTSAEYQDRCEKRKTEREREREREEEDGKGRKEKWTKKRKSCGIPGGGKWRRERKISQSRSIKYKQRDSREGQCIM